MENMNKTDIRFFPKENAAIHKSKVLFSDVESDLWINPKDRTVKYRNHWWNRKRKLKSSDYLDKSGYIRKGGQSQVPFVVRSYDNDNPGLGIHELRLFLFK